MDLELADKFVGDHVLTMARPRLPCETVGAHDTHILIVGAGFAGLAFARVVRDRAMRKMSDALVTHIDVSDENAVAAGDIKLHNAREVFDACDLRSRYARGVRTPHTETADPRRETPETAAQRTGTRETDPD